MNTPEPRRAMPGEPGDENVAPRHAASSGAPANGSTRPEPADTTATAATSREDAGAAGVAGAAEQADGADVAMAVGNPTGTTAIDASAAQAGADAAIGTPAEADVAAAQAAEAASAPARPKNGPGHHRGHGGGPRAQEKAISFGPSLRRLLHHLAPERVSLILVCLLSAGGVALNVVGPKILGRATDVIFAGIIGKSLSNLPPGTTKDMVVEGMRARGNSTFADMLAHLDVVPGRGIQMDQLGHVIMLALGLYLLSFLLLFVQGQLLAGAVQRSVYRMRKEVEAKLDKLPLSYFDRQPRGELLSRVTNDIDNVSQTLTQTLSQLLSSLFTLVGVLVMMFATSWLLSLIALIVVPLQLIAAVMIGKQSQKRFAAMWKNTGELNAQIEEAYSGHALVKVFGRQREVEEDFRRKNDNLFGAAFGAQAISGLIMPTMTFLGNLSYVLVAIVGGLRVAHGQLSVGDVQAFIQYSRMFTQPVSQLSSMANLLQSGVASAERVFEVLDAPELSPEGTAHLGPVRGEVVFDHVDFSYTDKPLITDLCLRAEPGQTIAIVGPTGAGKTTLVNLLMRFYEVRGGRILLDGTDITAVPREELRSHMGMVLQDTWLFHGSIRDNIAYGRPTASEAEIHEAAEATFVDRFVHSLPDGYDTVIDEEASNVSAGEKQLLTIARAFLADPEILILDEATSSVDTRTEVLVQRAMNALRADRTSFVIAHRLSTIRDADVIVVMEDGAIVEQGSHEQLLQRHGAYWRLYNSQFAGGADDDAALEADAAR